MKLKNLLVAIATCSAFPVFAQALGTVTNVEGVATVASGSNVTTLAKGAQVMNGSRIVTTSGSSVTVALNSGCALTVPAGHAVTVVSTMTCQQLQAAVQPVRPATAVMGQSGRFAAADPAVLIFAAAVAATAIYDATQDDDVPVSPR